MNVDEDRPRGPRALAEDVAANIVELEKEISTATCPIARKRLRQRLRLSREMLAWCKTRRGY